MSDPRSGHEAAPPLLAAERLGWHAPPHARPSRARRILGPIDLAIEHGESVAVVGPNGAGKTTLLRLLAGVLSPSEGVRRFAGRAFGDYSRKGLARRIAYVPQLRPVRVPLTVEEVVLLGRYPHLGALQLAPGRRDFAAVAEALAVVEIEPLRQRPVDELSGGERQAVYIAAALAQEAELLILDEPTTHLDPRHQRDIAALIPRLRREAGRTVITATHDLHFASLTAGRLVALQEGRVLASGTPAEILSPEVLESLFHAPFEVVRPGERPVTLLRLDP